ITKQSALLLAPIAGLAVLEHSWWMWRNQQKQRLVSSRDRVILSHIALFAVVTLLICGWWYVRNRQLYGDLFGLAVFQREFAAEAFDARSWAAWWGALAQLHASFWARFGWMNLAAPGWVIWFFTSIELVGLAGLLWQVTTNILTFRRLNVRTFAW